MHSNLQTTLTSTFSKTQSQTIVTANPYIPIVNPQNPNLQRHFRAQPKSQL